MPLPAVISCGPGFAGEFVGFEAFLGQFLDGVEQVEKGVVYTRTSVRQFLALDGIAPDLAGQDGAV